MVKFRKWEPERLQMQTGKIPYLRRVVLGAVVPPRHRSVQQMQAGKIPYLRRLFPGAEAPPRHRPERWMQAGKAPCPCRVVPNAMAPPRHLSVTGVFEALRLPRGCRRNAVQRSPIASRPVQSRKEFSRESGRERDRQSRRLERHQRLAHRPSHRECPVVLQRPAPRASSPALVRMTHTTPTSRQST